MDVFQGYFYQWLISNSLAFLFIAAAIKKPALARLLFFLLFAWACRINFISARDNPTDYLNYASLTPFGMYHDFILGWFKLHIKEVVSFISICQGLIAIGLTLKGMLVTLAAWGAIVFFIAIAPLGIGSGFPSTILTSIAMLIVLRKGNLDPLWKPAAWSKSKDS